MAWIRMIPPAEATGELAETYRAIQDARGGVALVHQVTSLNPRVVRAHLDLYSAIMFQRSSLDRIARERIATVVSAANRCAYCVAHHAGALESLGDDTKIIAALAAGEMPDSLPATDRTLLAWARRAATAPSDAGQADVAGLREAGLDDRAILDAILTVSYFSFVNRLTLLTGLDVEKDFTSTCVDGGE